MMTMRKDCYLLLHLISKKNIKTCTSTLIGIGAGLLGPVGR